ncbi:hypothetical protein IWW50_001787 [Coemansia erecta]|nr:hypothetical protein GGF43_003274 [Coemansia sp. RSA 2618]KAJ2827639.1 hypothetical protein IWW50_001787 [Coemansia erecta]
MVTTPMPANIRKRSEKYAKNVHNRGHVKKSLDPVVEERLEAERLRKKGLTSKQPALGPNARKMVLGLLLITLGSALYQIMLPLFGSSGRSAPANARSAKTRTKADLTREQQAKAAEAILQEMNRQAAEKYMRTAKDYKPPTPEAVPFEGGEDDEDDDGFVQAVPIPDTAEGPLV